MAKGKGSSTKSESAGKKLAKVKVSEADRELFGAYNSATSEYFQTYAQQRASQQGELAMKEARKLHRKSYERAKKDYIEAFGQDIQDMANAERILSNLSGSWKTQAKAFREGVYEKIDKDLIDKASRASISYGPPAPGDISSYKEASVFFQRLMVDLMKTIAQATNADGEELVKIADNIDDTGLSDADMMAIVSNLDKVQGILLKDSVGAGNAYYSLINNLITISAGFGNMFDKFGWMDLQGEKHSLNWFGTEKGKLTKKQSMLQKVKYGSVGSSIMTTIYLVQGALVERFVLLGLQSQMSELNQLLGDFNMSQNIFISGDMKDSSGKSIKADITGYAYKKGESEGGVSPIDIKAVGTTVKAASYEAKNIKFETTSQLKKIEGLEGMFPTVKMKNTFFTLTHIKNISGLKRNQAYWVKEIDKMSAVVGAQNIEDVVGSKVTETVPVYFMAFGDKFIPVYKFYEDLVSGKKSVYFVSYGEDFFKYNWTQQKDYEHLKAYGMGKFNYGSKGYTPYQTYVNTHVISKISAKVQYIISTN